MTTHDTAPSSLARWLGYGGLIPFVGLAAALWWARPDGRPLASLALLAYGASIASFLGAIHWGLVMREGSPPPVFSLVWGVVPSLLGWVAVLVGGVPGLVLVAVLLWLCFAVDRVVYPRCAVQSWLPLRLQLTVIASLSCLAAAVGLYG